MRGPMTRALGAALLALLATGASATITYHANEESFASAYAARMHIDHAGAERRLFADTEDFVFPLSTGIHIVNETIEVGSGETFDGLNKRYFMLRDDMDVPLVRVREGATVKNMVVGRRDGRGINIFGSCTIENVFFRNVGQGAAIRVVDSATQPMNLDIVGGGLRNALDVGIQINAPSTVSVRNYVFDTLRTGVYICEDCKKRADPVRVTVDNSFVRFKDAGRRFAGAEHGKGGNNQVIVKNLDILALVNRDIPLCEGPPGLCVEA